MRMHLGKAAPHDSRHALPLYLSEVKTTDNDLQKEP